jgi:hypothetical protein
MKEEHRNCPFCRHGELRVGRVELGLEDDEYRVVQCLNCEAQGPPAADEETAWRRWESGCERHVYDAEVGSCVCGEREGEPRLRFDSSALQCWFGLSYASYLTLPRVLMEAMPFEWQDDIAALLNQYYEAFPNMPDIGTRVQITDGAGHLIKTPRWLINYRRPDRAAIAKLRSNDKG